MNIVHVRYAIEVSKHGSINKASETLGMAQPNISRAIKDLESDLGITIFDRSARGMKLTPEGKSFIDESKKLLNELDELENRFRGSTPTKRKFAVSAPHADYISDAFSKLTAEMPTDDCELHFEEAGSSETIKKILSSDCSVGIVRHAAGDDKLLELYDKNVILFRPIKEFRCVILVSEDSDIVGRENPKTAEFAAMTEILPAEIAGELDGATSKDRIFASDRELQLRILSDNKNAFIRSIPLSSETLSRYKLCQIEPCDARAFKDFLVFRKDRKPTLEDEKFFELLTR